MVPHSAATREKVMVTVMLKILTMMLNKAAVLCLFSSVMVPHSAGVQRSKSTPPTQECIPPFPVLTR